uniref:ATP synthase F0 subunit 8 n=1 Tax=Butis melanostigma TaxID=150293 RepID=UPI0026E33A38|nr:ATP synthase F0 subunit 8 [Butis melanostigma]WJQ22770.1 ATP synthase F0 subunit 8 [Butis melanostigma]
MPQLNPAPWLAIFVFSWLVFLTVLLPKVLDFIPPNSPSAQNTKTSEKGSWNWPWY